MRKVEYNRTPTQIVFGKTRSRHKKPSSHFCWFYQIIHMLVKYERTYQLGFDKDFEKSLKQRNERHLSKKTIMLRTKIEKIYLQFSPLETLS